MTQITISPCMSDAVFDYVAVLYLCTEVRIEVARGRDAHGENLDLHGTRDTNKVRKRLGSGGQKRTSSDWR